MPTPDKWVLMKLSVLSSSGNGQVKGKPIEWEKISAKYVKTFHCFGNLCLFVGSICQ